MPKLKSLATLGAATAVAALMATGATAATLSLVGTASGTYTLTTPGVHPDGYDLPEPDAGTIVSYFSNADKNASNGLSLDGYGKVTYTYIGSEAGFENYSTYVGGALFQNYNPGATVQGTQASVNAGPGLLDFMFASNGGGYHEIANNGGASGDGVFNIGYANVGDSWYVFFDDNGAHVDYDDLVFRVDVAPIPVPAAGFLLLGGLGMLGVASRRRRRHQA